MTHLIAKLSTKASIRRQLVGGALALCPSPGGSPRQSFHAGPLAGSSTGGLDLPGVCTLFCLAAASGCRGRTPCRKAADGALPGPGLLLQSGPTALKESWVGALLSGRRLGSVLPSTGQSDPQAPILPPRTSTCPVQEGHAVKSHPPQVPVPTEHDTKQHS